MDKENTCGRCKHLLYGDLMGLKTAYCGFDIDDDFIVPHQSTLENGKRGDATIITLTRVPTCCKRDDVVKSERPAPRKDWVKIKV